MKTQLMLGVSLLVVGILTEILTIPIYFAIYVPFIDLDWHDGFCSELFDKECVGDTGSDDLIGFSCFWQSQLYKDRDESSKLGKARYCSGDSIEECYKSDAAQQRAGGDPRPFPYETLVDGKDTFPPAWLCSFDSFLTSSTTDDSTVFTSFPTLAPTGPTAVPTAAPSLPPGVPTAAPSKQPGLKKCLYLDGNDVSFDIGNKDYVVRYPGDDWQPLEDSAHYNTLFYFMALVGPLLLVTGAAFTAFELLKPPPFTPQLPLGARVEVSYGRGDFRVGVVAAAHRNGSFDIRYDNGSEETAVPLLRLQREGAHLQQQQQQQEQGVPPYTINPTVTAAAAPSAPPISFRPFSFSFGSRKRNNNNSNNSSSSSTNNNFNNDNYSSSSISSSIVIAPAAVEMVSFQTGTVVEANYAGLGQWSSATILHVRNSNNSCNSYSNNSSSGENVFELQYSDGTIEREVPQCNIRFFTGDPIRID